MRIDVAIVALLFGLAAPCAWPQAPASDRGASPQSGALATSQSYPDSPDGMKAQVENLFAAWRT
jgi:hypothetical protein